MRRGGGKGAAARTVRSISATTSGAWRGARIQLRELPVVARVAANHVAPGDDLRVRIASADPERPPATFQRVS